MHEHEGLPISLYLGILSRRLSPVNVRDDENIPLAREPAWQRLADRRGFYAGRGSRFFASIDSRWEIY